VHAGVAKQYQCRIGMEDGGADGGEGTAPILDRPVREALCWECLPFFAVPSLGIVHSIFPVNIGATLFICTKMVQHGSY
jgi:hypothetical protein